MQKWLKSKIQLCGVEEDVSGFLSWIVTILFCFFVVVRVIEGVNEANDDKDCIVYSMSDVIISPFYAIGCQLGKNRFKVRLN